MDPVNLAACDDSLRKEMSLIFAAGCILTLLIVSRLFRSTRAAAPTHVGLQLCYLANFWIIHWVAIPVYFLPWYCGEFANFTLLGARESLYGLIGLFVGSTLVAYWNGSREKTYGPPPEISRETRHRFLYLGLVFYVLTALLAGVTGLSAVLNGGQLFLIAGVVLCIWSAYRRGNRRGVMQWVAISLLFPFITVIRAGFLGFGFAALLPVMIAALCWMPKKNFAKLALWGLVTGYLGLSLFVTYMRDRNDLRRTVWGNQTYSNRLTQMANTFGNFEWFSPSEPRHLEILDGRLNQNYLVGAAVVHIDNTQEWAAGRTLWDAALAFIPRLLWPDKPTAGSGDLVSKYTGIEFAQGTSVGVGQVMEFYVNFGSPMVFLGFLFFGGVLAWLDRVAVNALLSGSTYRFIPAYLVGLSILQVGGSLLEVVTSAAGSLVIASVFNAWSGRSADARRVSRPVPVAG
jgi:hypothetical protein